MTTGPAFGSLPRRHKLTLTAFGKTLLDCARKGIRTLIPARVLVYNDLTGKADVTLQHNIVLATDAGETEQPPTIVPQCPVAFPSAAAGTAFIKMPLVPNDPGYIMISDRSLERWLTQGVPVDPATGHCHNIIDGVFHPQLRSAIDVVAPAVNPLALIIEAAIINIGNGAISPMVKGTELVAALNAYAATNLAADTTLAALADAWLGVPGPTQVAFAEGFAPWLVTKTAAQTALVAALIPSLSVKSFVL